MDEWTDGQDGRHPSRWDSDRHARGRMEGQKQTKTSTRRKQTKHKQNNRKKQHNRSPSNGPKRFSFRLTLDDMSRDTHQEITNMSVQSWKEGRNTLGEASREERVSGAVGRLTEWSVKEREPIIHRCEC